MRLREEADVIVVSFNEESAVIKLRYPNEHPGDPLFPKDRKLTKGDPVIVGKSLTD